MTIETVTSDEALAALDAQATPGKWKAVESVEDDFFGVYPDTGKMEFPIYLAPDYQARATTEANAELIVALVNAYRAGDLVPRTTAQAEIAALRAEVARLRGALEPFGFMDMGEDEDEGEPFTTQEVWETIYRDRVQDWISYEEIEAARAALSPEPKRVREGDEQQEDEHE